MNATSYSPERRPLGARHWSASGAAARWLATRGVSPDAISLTGLFASLGAGAALALTGWGYRPAPPLILACILILLRGCCNMLDGMVAVSTGKASRRGELFNEVPDRLSDSATLVGAGYALGGVPALGYLAALAAVFTAYVRVQGCALGAKADFRGPMAKVQRMFAVVAAALYIAFAPASWQPVLSSASPAGVMALALLLIIAGCVLTALLRLRRCARHLQEAPP